VPLTETTRDVGSINADRHRANAQGFECIQLCFNAPQLGVAKRSPIAAVENQKHALWNMPGTRQSGNGGGE
jgi:hypothetical protein